MLIGLIGNRNDLIMDSIKIDGVQFDVLEKPSQISEEHDIVFALCYYRIIKSKFLNRPKHGIFVVHASDLPKGRGWAPVNWALINQDSEIIVTSIKADEGCDTGPYFTKSRIPLTDIDTLKSAYEKVNKHVVTHVSQIIQAALDGDIFLMKQEGEPTQYARRGPEDSELDPNKSLISQWPLLRACHNEDYPAFFRFKGKKIYIRYEVEDGD